MKNKLNPVRSDYIIGGCACFILAPFIGIGVFFQDNTKQDVFSVAIMFIFMIIMGIFCFVLARLQRAYYMFMPDGIYIYKRSDILLATILWDSVLSYSVLKRNHNSNYPYYFVAVLDKTAMINGQLAIICSGKISDRIANKFLLNRAAERLARGKITTEQFLTQKVYLISATKGQLAQLKKLWLDSK